MKPRVVRYKTHRKLPPLDRDPTLLMHFRAFNLDRYNSCDQRCTLDAIDGPQLSHVSI